MGSKYAENTTVSEEQSRAEIERILERYGADTFSYARNKEKAIITFRAYNRLIRYEVIYPKRDEERFSKTPTGRDRSESEAIKEYQKETRRLWRALALMVKSKLELIETGISSFEREFLANVLLPDGSTVGEWLAPQLEQTYQSGKMPLLIPENFGD